MNTDDILKEHLTLCDEAYQLLNEENSMLKAQGQLSKSQLERKQALLARLDNSLAALKRLNHNPQARSGDTNKLIDRAQKRLMQIFLLDRENERLMGKGGGTSVARSSSRKPDVGAYSEHAARAEALSSEPDVQAASDSVYSDSEYTEESYDQEEYTYDEDYEDETEADYAEDYYEEEDEEVYDEPPAPETIPEAAPPQQYSTHFPKPQPPSPPRRLPRAYRQFTDPDNS